MNFRKRYYTCSLCALQTTCGAGDSGSGRRKRADEDVVFEDLNVGTSMSVGTDIDVNPTGLYIKHEFKPSCVRLYEEIRYNDRGRPHAYSWIESPTFRKLDGLSSSNSQRGWLVITFQRT